MIDPVDFIIAISIGLVIGSTISYVAWYYITK